MLLLGRVVDGAEAVGWGLIDRSVGADELGDAVDELARRLASGATVALGLTKWLMASGAALPLDAHLRNEGFAMELSSRSADFREGMSAFREKRPAKFEGR
jgi:2-(1,2-epoxy-1,2-dihydrophenyl)acetyl-CoA isomerase